MSANNWCNMVWSPYSYSMTYDLLSLSQSLPNISLFFYFLDNFQRLKVKAPLSRTWSDYNWSSVDYLVNLAANRNILSPN